MSIQETRSSRIGSEVGNDGRLVGAARTAESAARRLKERVVEAKDRLAESSIGELADDGRRYVRENPAKTILISVGIGALAGYVIGRRRS